MRVHVVSDVHGRAEALRAAADGADALICLGDLLLFVDYADPASGIFPDLFGAEAAREFIALRTAQRFDEARAMSARLWTARGGSPAEHLEAAASRQYAELFAALPTPSYLTYGNVDIPRMWAEHLRPGQHVLDGERVELGGWTFGFVGGGLRSVYRTPYELDDEVYAAKVDAVGGVDVLCAHIPPAVPELLFDTVATADGTGQRGAAGCGAADPAAVPAVRSRAPAAGPPAADRRHRVRQRRPLPRHRHAPRAGVVAARPARSGERRAGGTLRAWRTGPHRAS